MVLPVPGIPISSVIAFFGSPPLRMWSRRACPLEIRSVTNVRFVGTDARARWCREGRAPWRKGRGGPAPGELPAQEPVRVGGAHSGLDLGLDELQLLELVA